MINLKNDKSGFTLIELLIVTIVITSLTGILISVINVGALQGKARDAERVSDLKQIQTALELYFAENRIYPQSTSSNWILINGADAVSIQLIPLYINKIPEDPLGGTESNPCSSPDSSRYNYISDETYYVLTAIMEEAPSNDESPCDSLNAWASYGLCGAGYTTADVCYGVENP